MNCADLITPEEVEREREVGKQEDEAEDEEDEEDEAEDEEDEEDEAWTL